MKIIFKLLLFLILVFCFSCEEQGLFVKCPDCTAKEPDRTELEFKLDFSYRVTILIKIYEGNLDDSILLYSDRIFTAPFNYEVTINKKYTATATYDIQNNEYIAIDSATPRVKYEKEQCDDPCYFVYDKIIDLRLKYTK
ncbi:MAG: hypothetical protein ABSF81_11365 [Bacteroidales bacterium]|jgi:hypothetical protein